MCQGISFLLVALTGGHTSAIDSQRRSSIVQACQDLYNPHIVGSGHRRQFRDLRLSPPAEGKIWSPMGTKLLSASIYQPPTTSLAHDDGAHGAHESWGPERSSKCYERAPGIGESEVCFHFSSFHEVQCSKAMQKLLSTDIKGGSSRCH